MPEIEIEKPISEFTEHLLSNERILFFGKFGIGKTYFLKKYFETRKEKHNVFHLFPVNYQVATNEDIFELVKYDILCHMLNFDWVKIEDRKKFATLMAIKSLLLNDGVNIAIKAMSNIPVVAKAKEVIDFFKDVSEIFIKHKDESNKNNTKLLNDYFNYFSEKQGSVHEFDAISKFICEQLASCNKDISESERHKENILIIDDLDRIDPGHIFRLLNVFSAHIDTEKNKNKFGFDKIIFVCDVENIRHIFSAKYGENTDFSGYIDKFYSSEIFRFDNKIAISEFINSTVNYNYPQNQQISSEVRRSISNILILLVQSDTINLRRILENIIDWNKNEKVGVIRCYYYSGYTVLWACYKIMSGLKDDFTVALKKITSSYIDGKDVLNEIASLTLPLLVDDIYNENACLKEMNYTRSDVEFKLNIHRNPAFGGKVFAVVDPTTHVKSYDKVKELLITATEKLEKNGLLK